MKKNAIEKSIEQLRLQSAIYSGWVWHKRHEPKSHAFRYRVFMLYLDLAELETVFAKSWFWSMRRPALARFKRADFLGDPRQALGDSVRDTVESELGFRPQGPIRLLANIRYWGFIINPISCYYCLDTSGTRLEAVVLEVTNTPWKERKTYVLRCDSSQVKQQIDFDKQMHVSPFFPMDMQYQWRGAAPAQQLAFSVSNAVAGKQVFNAGVNLQRERISAASLASVLLRFPFMTLKVFAAIHWQALKLWLKGIKIVKHQPKGSNSVRARFGQNPMLNQIAPPHVKQRDKAGAAVIKPLAQIR